MLSEVWGEIGYPFPNFKGCTVEVWEWIDNFIPHLVNGCNYLSILGLKLIVLAQGAPGPIFVSCDTYMSSPIIIIIHHP